MASVLEGVRVLDLSSGIAGPMAGMLLADHGADVVKVEPPGGDPLRGTAGYDVWLRGRRSAELDLKDAEDEGHVPRPRLRRRCRPGSFSPGTTSRLGIDAATLLAAQPAVGLLLDHRVRPARRRTATAPATTRWSPPGSASCTSSAVISGGAMPHMHGDEPYLPDLEIPDGMAPGSPRIGTDLHLHAVAEHVRRVPCRRRHQRRALRRGAHRPWTARRDLVAASGVQPHRVEVAARRASTTRPATAPGSTTSARRRGSSAAPTTGGSSSGCRTRASCSPAPTATPSRSGGTSTASATTPTASRPTRRTSSCSRTTTR